MNMKLRDFINITYRNPIPIIEDFIDDEMEFLLNKKINSISTKVVKYDAATTASKPLFYIM